ncbi:type II secretion system protein [bacterium]|nr:MAG: type II secretion system protein [bacterium]
MRPSIALGNVNSAPRGFSLIEIVIVLAIIGILAAFLFPVFTRARRDADKTTSSSNLRQCWFALRHYSDDYGGDAFMPPSDVAEKVLKNSPTCDPNDTWRASCNEVFGPPLIGSYAYIRSIEGFFPPNTNRWNNFTSRNWTLLASIYYATDVPAPFHGDVPPPVPGRYPMPDQVLRLRLDGSVRSERQFTANGKRRLTWSALLFSSKREPKK